MADRTATHRVRRYREAQRKVRDIRRVEVQVPSVAAEDVKGLSRKLRASFGKAAAAGGPIRSVLATINAPRPYPISSRELVHCLVTDHPDPRWRPHIEAFFDEVSEEAIHDIVLAGVVSFEDLMRAARNWRVTDGRNVDWINEMADLRLARPAA
jgi:hypothetical protein